ncbi:MAG: hypothetical protein IIW68_06695 [Lachnospiraceae bacterium]|nr:hypothetical protein [Lachnospiraceae bacterium]
MAHIEHTRQIELCRELAVKDLFPHNLATGNFAVFSGDINRRLLIANHAIRPYVGKMGVVFLHGDPFTPNRLGDLVRGNPDVNLFFANRNLENARIYDPLYGLGENAILDIIFPDRSKETERARLGDYLSIMEYQFEKNPSVFGNYPYNLDLLLELTRMPADKLKKTVLDYLPKDKGDSLNSRLSEEKIQQTIYDAVDNFCKLVKETLWTPTDAARHSRVSIVAAAKNKDIISVYVPNSDPSLFDYLFHELDALIKSGTPFLLVESGLNLKEKSKLSELFFKEHSHLGYRTGILSQTIASVLNVDNNDELIKLASEYHEIVVMNCSSVTEAEPFSQLAGIYFRQSVSSTKQRFRNLLSLIPSLGSSTQTTDIQERNIRPEEIRDLNNGIMLYGRNHRYPILVRSFYLD